jgi:3-oxoacyl-[acyl-carrier-protein] synthase-3
MANKLGSRAVAFDVNAACSGFVYGLAVANGLMQTQPHHRVAVCAAEKFTRVVDWTDRRNAIFWGDSAATVLLQRDLPAAGAELVDVVVDNVNEGADLVRIPHDGHFVMDGPRVKEIALKGFVASARAILERNGLHASDLRAFMGHQPNLRMLELLCDAIGLEDSQHWHNVEMHGNQGAAGVASTLSAGLERHAAELRDGDLFLLTVFGSGFTGGSALLRWRTAAAAATRGAPRPPAETLAGPGRR